MKAAWYQKNGPAEQVLAVGELAMPRPGKGEVLVRVHSSGVNPSDVKSRQGLRAPIAFARVVPHSDGAGVIEAVGEGVDMARVGERVWLWNAQWRRPFGTAGEYCALPSAQAVELPADVDFPAGACLGIPAMTAHACLFSDGAIKGKRILVSGGAGAVGHAAIQLARWAGARVIATVSGPAKSALATSAGAQTVINYRSENVAERVREATEGEGVDRVIEVDFAANIQAMLACIRPNGVIAAYASSSDPEPKIPFYPMMFQGLTLRTILVYILSAAQREAAIRDINAALESGALSPHIDSQYGLEAIATAHGRVESGNSLGNVVVNVD
jgi:NADPH2:quinone reductase